MEKTYKKISIIGGGTMGTVLAQALVKSGSVKTIFICEKNIGHYKKLKKISPRVRPTGDLLECSGASIVFLAVKPQDFKNVELKVNKQALICSIMAGIPIAEIRDKFETGRIIRLMPNMAACANESFTVWTAAAGVKALEKKWMENFLSKMGAQFYVKSEQQIDKATAVTGSGPAYIFYTLLAFKSAAEKLGFSPKEAGRMVHQVLRGARALIDKNTDLENLTKQVASKGGTTEAALQVFSSSSFKKTWERAVAAAYKRARQLSKNN